MALATRTESLSLYYIVGRQAVLMDQEEYSLHQDEVHIGVTHSAKETYRLGKQWYEVREASI